MNKSTRFYAETNFNTVIQENMYHAIFTGIVEYVAKILSQRAMGEHFMVRKCLS